MASEEDEDAAVKWILQKFNEDFRVKLKTAFSPPYAEPGPKAIPNEIERYEASVRKAKSQLRTGIRPMFEELCNKRIVPRILYAQQAYVCGHTLFQKDLYTEAQFCLDEFLNLEEKTPSSDVVQALFTKAQCLFYAVMKSDQTMARPATLDICISALDLIQKGMEMVVAAKEDTWNMLHYNGSLLIYEFCNEMIKYGFASNVVNYLSWSLLCLESVIAFTADVNYLEWRIRIYIAVAKCYEYTRQYPQALTVLVRAEQKIQEVHQNNL